jgi:hypothetical protein
MRAAGEVVNQGEDFVVAQSVRSKTVNRCLNGGRCHQIRLIAVTPGMQNLQGDFAPFLMHGIGYQAVMRKLIFIIKHRAALHRYPRERRRYAAGDNQRHTMTRAFGIEGRQPVRAIGALFQAGVH